MATTIPGGYYIGQDGQPHDCDGKPVSPPVEPETGPIGPVDEPEAEPPAEPVRKGKRS